MDVMGIAFRRELYLSTRQVYPPLQDREKGIHTRVQAKLLRKLGNNSYPFFFEVTCQRHCRQAETSHRNKLTNRQSHEFKSAEVSREKYSEMDEMKRKKTF